MATGVLPWENCITHRIGCEQAPAIFQRINQGRDRGIQGRDRDIVGVVIDWR